MQTPMSCSYKNGMKRRQMLAISAAALLPSACNRRQAPSKSSRVSISKVPGYTQDLYEVVRRIFKEHALDLAGKRVIVKPNLVEFDKTTCVNTHPMVVHAVYEAAKSLGAADVRIAEGPGHRRTTMDLAEAAGYYDTVARFEDRCTDLNLDDVALVQIPRPVSKLNELYLPKTILGADLIISVPKMKTHHWVGATLSMKNFFGVVPGAVYGWPKNVLHWAGIDQCIMDLHTLVPKTFALVDGIMGMEGNGPIQGTPKHAGVLVAGRDLPSVDSTCCRIMGIDPAQVMYVAKTQNGPIEQIGEPISSVRTNFQLIAEFGRLRLA
jgi:uncharacterized protein (DUF362 family)